jgi:hypothetical protein
MEGGRHRGWPGDRGRWVLGAGCWMLGRKLQAAGCRLPAPSGREQRAAESSGEAARISIGGSRAVNRGRVGRALEAGLGRHL